MILGFMQRFPWKEPTYFREKILAGAGRGPIVSMPKIHTMRVDSSGRWKAGMKIQMVYRGPKYSISDHFNKGIPEIESCISTQRVQITWIFKNEYVQTILPCKKIKGPHGEFEYYPSVWVEDNQLSNTEILMLAINDGFDGLDDFFRWFKNDFTGKIIHWTNFKYYYKRETAICFSAQLIYHQTNPPDSLTGNTVENSMLAVMPSMMK
jgi:hypothetical protein